MKMIMLTFTMKIEKDKFSAEDQAKFLRQFEELKQTINDKPPAGIQTSIGWEEIDE